MEAIRQALPTVGQGCVLARADLRAVYTWRTWLGAWLVRMLCQVAFFGLVGRMAVGQGEDLVFVVTGAALVVAATEPMLAIPSTTWDRNLGTDVLLAAAPIEPGFFYVGRSLQWPVSGTVTTSLVFATVTPLFGLTWAISDVPVLLLLVAVTAFASYGMALVFGALALRAVGARNIISQLVVLSTTAFCGALVPLGFWPRPLPWLAQAVPFTHGLEAVRALERGGGWAAVVSPATVALLVGLVWCAAAVGAFRYVTLAQRI